MGSAGRREDQSTFLQKFLNLFSVKRVYITTHHIGLLGGVIERAHEHFSLTTVTRRLLLFTRAPHGFFTTVIALTALFYGHLYCYLIRGSGLTLFFPTPLGISLIE